MLKPLLLTARADRTPTHLKDTASQLAMFDLFRNMDPEFRTEIGSIVEYVSVPKGEMKLKGKYGGEKAISCYWCCYSAGCIFVSGLGSGLGFSFEESFLVSNTAASCVPCPSEVCCSHFVYPFARDHGVCRGGQDLLLLHHPAGERVIHPDQPAIKEK